MAVYAVTGKLGSGKGKGAVHKMREYLRQGKRVATNFDLFLEHLMPDNDRSTVIRVPDKPTAADLYMIGSGNPFIKFEPIISEGKDGFQFTAPSPEILPGFDESHNGLLVLDELGSWFNTRNFQDKGRAALLEYVIHMRKYGWDCLFLMQNISQVDKQLRDAVLEYVVRFTRLDRLKVPFVSPLIKLGSAGAFEGAMPRMHIGVVRLGANPDAMVADRWVFRGDDLNKAYNTTQVFSDTYPNGIHSLISAWHLSGAKNGGKRAVPPKPVSLVMKTFIVCIFAIGIGLGALGTQLFPVAVAKLEPTAVAHDQRVFSTSITGIGLFKSGMGVQVILSDGRAITPMRFLPVPGGWEAQIEHNLWVRGRDA